MHGKKIANLWKLSDSGIIVPKFQVVSFINAIDDYSAFKDFFQSQLSQDPAIASANIRKYLSRHLSINADLKTSGNKLYAVRSATNFEDGETNSFAGQFKTFLNVPPREISEKVIECMLSVCNENVFSYIESRKVRIDDVRLDIIVQEMVKPDYSGVVFTSNPQGLLNETVIAVGEGVGEKVVSEKVLTTSYFYNRTDSVYYYVGEKDLLSPEQIKEIIRTVGKIELILGQNMDIEFAISKGTLFVLQARKITTLDTANPLVMDNSNIVESYPGISLPLTISFAKMVYSGVFKSECRRLLRNDNELNKHQKVFEQMVGACNGRMYYKISNWYELMNYLPFHKKVAAIWNDMMGVAQPLNHKTRVSPLIRLRVTKNFIGELRRVNENMKWLGDHFLKVESEYRSSFSKELTIDESLKLFHKVARRLFPYWDFTLINDMYTFINVGLLKKRLGEKANEVISDISDLESMKPIMELVSLSVNKDKLSEFEYQKKLHEYIDLYGDRGPEELKLESKTFRTNPELLEAAMDDYRSGSVKLGRMSKRMAKELRSRPLLLRKNIQRCKTGIRNREKSRLYRSRIFGIVRELMLHVGECLVEQKRIEDKNDIFYLKIDEIERLNDSDADLKAIVSERKKQYTMFSHLPAYSRLVFAEHEFDKVHNAINAYGQTGEESRLRGTPCSSGKVSGEALVIDSAVQVCDAKNKILVARSTDPGWVFMLAKSKGIISERGSLLSHTAIISRELGIPSIVGVPDATKIIKTGDKITMDGKSGTIMIEDRK